MTLTEQRKSLMAPKCPWCPSQDPMRSTGPSLHDTNFDQWQCPRCDRQGATATNGTQLVFRGGEEFIFTFGASMRSMTVRLSADAIDLFRTHRIDPQDLARRMAEWALLRGWSHGTVCLDSTTDDLRQFHRYCYPDNGNGDHKVA